MVRLVSVGAREMKEACDDYGLSGAMCALGLSDASAYLDDYAELRDAVLFGGIDVNQLGPSVADGLTLLDRFVLTGDCNHVMGTCMATTWAPHFLMVHALAGAGAPCSFHHQADALSKKLDRSVERIPLIMSVLAAGCGAALSKITFRSDQLYIHKQLFLDLAHQAVRYYYRMCGRTFNEAEVRALRRAGASTRIGFAEAVRHLESEIVAGSLVDQHKFVLHLLTKWHRAETSWSQFMAKMLWHQFRSQSELIVSFLLGECDCATCVAVADSHGLSSHSLVQTLCVSGAGVEAAVIAHIEHIEPAASIDPQEAEVVNSVLEAGFVERNLGVGFLADHTSRGTYVAESCIVLLHFGRFPRELRDAILKSQLASDLLSRAVDLLPFGPSGGIMLADVPPRVVSEGRWHVAVCEEHEQQVHQLLRSLAHDVRPRLKRGDHGRSLIPNFIGASHSSIADDTNTLQDVLLPHLPNQMPELIVERTFIHFPAARMRGGSSVRMRGGSSVRLTASAPAAL